ncbi:glucose-1-phosphate cytidylyltransferase [Paenibacillus sp. CGMCC 1.16610]|uniref:Glucose-1-phosphate cytidylyltransferase n=1 Tax=Paenibacillus anseongense TaxID=2682845 RepID=A0ABW9U8H2_9BACL|nr:MULTISPECIES: glucose-1-phosphate cytidylyltransferase [Paenibacillus]MBA2940911.1 glucose-1-phosphate cytidylyltransferase [Paenibacillus sp. CGMCC 1.16610]MVQ34095.1 glucose-1-phosphate cytidylyltransferase [Paenibacillus anseongense]
MKVVILAGGLGTRFREETHSKPKPMILIGDKPILWHIMKIYSFYGFNEFIICLGYKGHVIKDFFANYPLHASDITVDLQKNTTQYLSSPVEPWKITLVHTGDETMTGGRIKRIQKYIGDEPFLLTYGDGLTNVNIPEVVKFHQAHGKFATLTAVQPTARFGSLIFGNGTEITKFQEKPKGEGGWINGGFFVLQPQVFDHIDGDPTHFEKEPLEQLAASGQLHAYKHADFWYAMDTLRDQQQLQKLWDSGQAPWKIW